jgi:long-subunit fatty acid transport protein
MWPTETGGHQKHPIFIQLYKFGYLAAWRFAYAFKFGLDVAAIRILRQSVAGFR